MEQLRQTYYNSAQQIEKSEHYVRFGKSPANIESKFDESKYMDPPIMLRDDYYWLRDDSRTNKKVLDVLKSENELVETIMVSDSSNEIQTKLYEEIKSYINETYESLPMPHGDKGWNSDYYYWVRTLEGKSYPIHMRTKQVDEKTVEVLLDENELAEGYNTFDLYGAVINPFFNSNIFPLLDRGFVYAIAHIRGGSFLGTEWYENGKMLNKMNTFNDFISCTEHLITQSYTSVGNIVIEGSSAGGLLVGATMVMRPELFRTVIAGVPFK